MRHFAFGLLANKYKSPGVLFYFSFLCAESPEMRHRLNAQTLRVPDSMLGACSESNHLQKSIEDQPAVSSAL